MKSLLLSAFTKGCNESPEYDSKGHEHKIRTSLLAGKPVELLCYTKTATGEIKINDKQGLKILNIPVGQRRRTKAKNDTKLIGADLSEGFSNFKRPGNNEIYKLDTLCTAFRGYLEGIEHSQKPEHDLKPCVISLRRNLLMLMQIPLYHWKECRFNVISWKGLIILDYDWKYFDDDIAAKLSGLSLSSKDLELLQYTGFKFETLITLTPEEICDFYSLVSQDHGEFNTIFTAEIDAAVSGLESLSSYVELKTHGQTKSNMDSKLSAKLISTWCQTKLVGGKYAVVGFRSKDNRLSSIKKYNTNEIGNLIQPHLPKLPNNLTITCNNLLQWYKHTLKWLVARVSEDPTAEKAPVFKLHYLPGPTVSDSCLLLDQVDDGESIFRETIPDWFQSYMDGTKD